MNFKRRSMKTSGLLFSGIFFFLSLTITLAQERSDKLADSLSAALEKDISEEERANTLVKLGKHFRQSDTDLATTYLDDAIALSQKIGKDRIMADAYYQKGIVMKYTRQPDLKFQYFSIAGSTYLELGDTLWYCRAAYEMGKYFTYDRLNLDTATYLLEKAFEWVDKNELLDVSLYSKSLADVYSYQDRYYKSIDTYQKAIDALKLRGDTINWTSSLQKMANVHYYLGEYEKMVELINESSTLIKLIEQDAWTKSFLQNNYMNMSIALLEIDKIEEATPYLLKADSMAREEGEITAYLDHTMAEYHYRIGNVDSAFFRFKRAISSTRADQDMRRLPVLLNGLGELYFDQKNYTSARRTLLESIQISKSTNQPKTYSDGLETLAKTSAALGEYKKAFEYYGEYHTVSDSLLNEEKIREITTLTNQYAFEEEKEEIAQKQREKELLLQAEIQRKEFVQYGLFAGLGIAALVALLFYRFYQSKKKDNVKISQQADELQKKHEETTELSNYKQGLTQMIAHDMKNPLNVIIAIADKPEGKESWAEVGQSGKLMLQMVNNMLDIQRFEETKMNLKVENLPLADLVTHSKYQVELLMMAKSIGFDNQIDPSMIIEADADIISRIFVNLFTNAIKYMPIGGKIEVKAEGKNERVHISVLDTGKGIPKDVQAHIFDKFWQSDPKKFGMSTSNGLGLTFCKLATMAHGGEIHVESEEGNGATFVFDLPIGEEIGIAEIKQETFTDESHLTEEEIALVRKLSKELRRVPIYRSTRIEEILRSIESEQSPGIVQWRQKLREAFYSYDNEAFEELTTYE